MGHGDAVPFPDFNEGKWDAVLWIVIVGSFLCVIMAWAIGANDVANAFGTSVGSQTLKLWQACLLAGIFEFAGAMLLGSPVADTVGFYLADIQDFLYTPEVLAYGMMCALASSAAWVTWATFMGLAISTTHSIIGGIVGFALVFNGPSGVVWEESQTGFPFHHGIVTIVLSWVITPFLSAAVASLIYLANRHLILRRNNSVKLAFLATPLLVGVTLYISLFLVLSKGADDKLHWSLAKAAWVSAIITAGGILLIVTLGFLLIRGHISSKWLKDWSARLAGVVEATNIDPSNHTNRDPSHHTNLDPSNHGNRDPSNRGNRDPSNHGNHTMSMYPISERPESGVIVQSSVAAQAHSSMSIVKEWITRVSTKGLHKDIFVGVTNNETVSRIHGGAENYDVETEKVYNYLLVFSACCLAFAHGGNDVANAVAPFSTIWHIYCTWSVTDETSTPTWILAVGGISMVIGLATLGYKVMRTIGVDLIMLSPSRGFSANLATALVVSLCSGLAIPVSTTHCIVGAEVGIGMCDNLRHGTNVRLLVKTITAWLSTMVITGVMSAALFALGVFSPSQTHNDMIYADYLAEMMNDNIFPVNLSNYNNSAIFNWTTPYLNETLNISSSDLTRQMAFMLNSTLSGAIQIYPFLDSVAQSQQLVWDHGAEAVGYNVLAGNFSTEEVAYPAL